MKRVVASGLQVVGLGSVTVGLWSLADWLGFVFAGLAAVVVGVALERGDV